MRTSLKIIIIVCLFTQGSVYTFIGSSDSSGCGERVKDIFNFTAPCPEPPCTFDGVHQPPLMGDFMVSVCRRSEV